MSSSSASAKSLCFRPGPATGSLIDADICRPDLLVEIEARFSV